jgi:hypothetical protein
MLEPAVSSQGFLEEKVKVPVKISLRTLYLCWRRNLISDLSRYSIVGYKHTHLLAPLDNPPQYPPSALHYR